MFNIEAFLHVQLSLSACMNKSSPCKPWPKLYQAQQCTADVNQQTSSSWYSAEP